MAALLNPLRLGIFTADSGSLMVWILRHVAVNGRRRTLLSLLHGTMANAMPMALGAQKAFPGRQVIAFSGDGGIAMLLGDPAHRRPGGKSPSRWWCSTTARSASSR